MGGDIVNLNKVRKAKAKAEKEIRAQANRAKFGRTKEQKLKEGDEILRRQREIDGAKRQVQTHRPDGQPED